MKRKTTFSLRHPSRTSLSKFLLSNLASCLVMGCVAGSASVWEDGFDKSLEEMNREAAAALECGPSSPTDGSTVLTSVRISRREPEMCKSESWWYSRRTDLFVFDADSSGRMDSYTRVEASIDETVTVSSGTGRKKLVAIANADLEESTIASVCSYGDLAAVIGEFRYDSPEYPIMSGERIFYAGKDDCPDVEMEPLMSEIRINSLICDIEGKTLECVSAYLTNASGSCGLLSQSDFSPVEYINYGKNTESDLRKLKYPAMLNRYLGDGKEGTDGWNYGKASLYCYPNTVEEESAGSPFTRLVIEGELDGETRYYPININREGFGYSGGTCGVARNTAYIYNIKLTSCGSDSPDSPIDVSNVIQQGSISLHPGNILTGADGDSLRVWVDVCPESTEVVFDREDLEDDRKNGIYDYTIDEDGKGVTLKLLGGGTGMFIIEAGPPVNDGFLVIVVVNP